MTRSRQRKRLLTGTGRAISAYQGLSARCPVCLGPVAKGKKICSPRCRLVKWAAGTLLEALRAGKADGLRDDVVRELTGLRR